ncbi:nucleotide-binding protein [Variovorax sp. J22P240]|uniref:nucleotide-binding protein n=1 Tax=Variovorax sp. J22P240 TaxID=3053514 RepID=UPI0025756BBE|nr:nucleotide-binding protein [Variovorax sp. J22P240]MDM0002816.1 nucleotide-binding protein [Variovorax sp. J22P240]
MLKWDRRARVFVGSSSEGRATAAKVAEALEVAGMRALLWCDFFKTKDPPLQELERRAEDADGAILVGSADDRLQSRGESYEQMRDNVLFEYGLFAGRLGRHRCILLMPDKPQFRIPSDFLGVAGFEWYSDMTLSDMLKRVPKRLSEGFAADAFHPPSLQERCRRALLLAAWIRGEIAQIDPNSGRWTLTRTLGEKAKSVLAFLKEDIEALGLRADVDKLCKLVRNASDSFPGVPGRNEIRCRLHEELERFLRNPRSYYLPSRWDAHNHRQELEELLGRDGPQLLAYAQSRALCPSCVDERACLESRGRPSTRGVLPIKRRHYHDLCLRGWYLGAIDMLDFVTGELNSLDDEVDALDAWRRRWVPEIVAKVEEVEAAVHRQIFGHL